MSSENKEEDGRLALTDMDRAVLQSALEVAERVRRVSAKVGLDKTSEAAARAGLYLALLIAEVD